MSWRQSLHRCLSVDGTYPERNAVSSYPRIRQPQPNDAGHDQADGKSVAQGAARFAEEDDAGDRGADGPIPTQTA